MASTLLGLGDRAFVEEDYTEALKHYTDALRADPSNAQVLESRSHCHIKQQNYVEAAEDASKAIELDPAMAKAYLRKG